MSDNFVKDTQRFCYLCHETISLTSFKYNAEEQAPNLSLEGLYKIWDSPFVQILCCHCYCDFTEKKRYINWKVWNLKKLLNIREIDVSR